MRERIDTEEREGVIEGLPMREGILKRAETRYAMREECGAE